MAAQEAQFGGAGQIGSARQALASRALAGQTQSTQAKIAADIMADIADRRAAAAGQLIGAGQAGLAGAQGAASNIVTAAMTPQGLYNQYASVLFGTPSQSWAPDFSGTQGMTRTTDTSRDSWNFSI